MEKSEDIVPSFALSSNSRYEATAFGFHPNNAACDAMRKFTGECCNV